MSNLIEANLGPDDKATGVIVFTKSLMAFGSIISNKTIIPSRMLLGETVPDYLALYDAQMIPTYGGTLGKPIKYPELHVPCADVVGFQLAPNETEEVNYDPNEPNRIMLQTQIWMGAFLVEAEIRISTQTDLRRFLDVSKGRYITVYNAKITCPGTPGLKPIRATMLLVDRVHVYYAGINA